MDSRSLAAGTLPVAIRYLAPPARAHLRVINLFAASLSGGPPSGDTGDRFDRLEAGLVALSAGRVPEHPVLDGLTDVVGAYGLPVDVLCSMVAAARTDWGTTSYATFAQLAECCHRAARPRGELALRVLGQATEERMALCHFIATGTCLLGHVLTAAVDWRAGRRYVPMDELDRYGMAGEDPGTRWGWRRAGLLGLQAERARALLESGAPLVATLRGRPRLAVAAHLARCRATLTVLHRQGYRLREWPRPSGASVLGQWAHAVSQYAG